MSSMLVMVRYDAIHWLDDAVPVSALGGAGSNGGPPLRPIPPRVNSRSRASACCASPSAVLEMLGK